MCTDAQQVQQISIPVHGCCEQRKTFRTYSDLFTRMPLDPQFKSSDETRKRMDQKNEFLQQTQDRTFSQKEMIPPLFAFWVSFLVLDPSMAKSVVARWKPQFVLDQLVSSTNINAFAQAMIHLEDKRCKCFLLSPSHVGYVVLTDEGQDYLLCILWTQEDKCADELRSLQKWYTATAGIPLNGSLLSDSIERDLWISSFEM